MKPYIIELELSNHNDIVVLGQIVNNMSINHPSFRDIHTLKKIVLLLIWTIK